MEKKPFHNKGTFINGYFDTEEISYGENYYGSAKNKQTILNLPNVKDLELRVNGNGLELDKYHVKHYERILNLRDGVLSRQCQCIFKDNSEIAIYTERVVSLNNKNECAFHYTIQPTTPIEKLVITTGIEPLNVQRKEIDDPRINHGFRENNLELKNRVTLSDGGILFFTTSRSKLSFSVGYCLNIFTDCEYRTEKIQGKDFIRTSLILCNIQPGSIIELFKYATYHTSISKDNKSLLSGSTASLNSMKTSGFEQIKTDNKNFLSDFWNRCDIEINGDSRTQQGIRYNLFQLLQASRFCHHTSIPAKGLTGEGYEGHYFWDTEIYILPFLIYNFPELARNVLMYRHHTLDKARARARELDHRGALYAWRTISGEEASAYFPAGTAQYHINADICYALQKYMLATNDFDFLASFGAEIAIETARFWLDIGDYIENKNYKFCINCVTGPDEYTAIVNNNSYTNHMAQNNMLYAVEVINYLKANCPNEYIALCKKVDLSENELDDIQRAATQMYIPYDSHLGIHPQDDTFLDKAVWDFHNLPKDKFPLLLNYHPLNIYRYQICKQPDLILATFLCSEKFHISDKIRNFKYYEPLTTGDSSLSASIMSIMACETNQIDKSLQYFLSTIRMDLDDINGNTEQGLHASILGGSWLTVIYGYAGLRDRGGQISFNPRLPSIWNRLSFRILCRSTLFQFELDHDHVSYTHLEGPQLTIFHKKTELVLKSNQKFSFSTRRQLRAVVFDLDGVITDTAEYHYLAWKRLADEQGWKFDRSLNEQLKGVTRIESLKKILEHNQVNINTDQLKEYSEIKNGYYIELLKKLSSVDILPGIKKFLTELRSRGVKIGLASASKNAQTVLDRLNCASYFDVITDATEIVKGKPDPEIFLKTADLLNVAYEDCVGIEDAQAGIHAIKGANMFAVGIGALLKDADWLLENTTALEYGCLIEKLKLSPVPQLNSQRS